MSWQEDAIEAHDQMTAAWQAAKDATDATDRHLHLNFAQDAASRLAWIFNLAVMDATIWKGEAW